MHTKNKLKVSCLVLFLVITVFSFIPYVSAETMIFVNEQAGRCSIEICSPKGGTCLGGGTDAGATNNRFYTDVESCFATIDADICDERLLTDGGGPCAGFLTKWTYCRCDIPVDPTVTNAFINYTSPIALDLTVRVNSTITVAWNKTVDQVVLIVNSDIVGEYNLTPSNDSLTHYYYDYPTTITELLNFTWWVNQTTGESASGIVNDSNGVQAIQMGLTVPIILNAEFNVSSVTDQGNVRVNYSITNGSTGLDSTWVVMMPPLSATYNITPTQSGDEYYYDFLADETGKYYAEIHANNSAGEESLPVNASDQDGNLYLVVSAADNLSISITYPQQGCSNGDGCDGADCSICTYCSFSSWTSNFDSLNATGQNSTFSFFNITNNGNIVINIDAQFNQTFNSSLSLHYSNTSTNAYLNISQYPNKTIVQEDLEVGDTLTMWVWLSQDASWEDIQYYAINITGNACGNGNENFVEECDDGNNINGDGCNSTCGLECVSIDALGRGGYLGYSDYIYMQCHPVIKSLTLDVFNDATDDYFWTFLADNGTTNIDVPAQLQQYLDYETAGTFQTTIRQEIQFELDEYYQTLAAHAALRIYHDKNGTFLWDLESNFTSDELDGFFSSTDGPFDGQFLGKYKQFYAADYNPISVYNYSEDNNINANNPLTLLYQIINDTRGNNILPWFRHSVNTEGYYRLATSVYRGLTLDTDYQYYDSNTPPRRVARQGSHSMSRIILALWRSRNLPGHMGIDGEWYYPLPVNRTGLEKSRASPIFYTGATNFSLLVYGDLIFWTYYYNVTAEQIVMPHTYFLDHWDDAVCGTINYSCDLGFGTDCINGSLDNAAYDNYENNFITKRGEGNLTSYNRYCVTGRYLMNNTFSFPSASTIDEYCNANTTYAEEFGRNYTDGFDYINLSTIMFINNSASPIANVISQSEMEAFNTSLDLLC